MKRRNVEPLQSGIHARGFRIAIVVSQFNKGITDSLLEGARACLRGHGSLPQDIEVFVCPGAFELPQVANKLVAVKKWDAIICLGAVIRGETPHFEYVSSETARGIQEVALRSRTPIAFGVLTTHSEKQALERAGGKFGNKGWDAAAAAVQMIALFRRLEKGKKSFRMAAVGGRVRRTRFGA